MQTIKSRLAKELLNARSYYEDNYLQNTEDALGYFNRELPGIIDKDVSEYFKSIVSPDVPNAVEHTLADIMPAFASESPVVFVPEGPGDEAQAQVETKLVNNIFLEQNSGFIQLTTAIKDSLLRRLGVVEVQTVKRQEVSYLTIEDTNIEILTSMLEQQSNDQIDIVDIEEADETGYFIKKVQLRKTTEVQSLVVKAFPPDELLFNGDHEEPNLDSARFVARERILTSSELVELGYSRELIDTLPDYAENTYQVPHKQDQITTDNTNLVKKVRVAFCYFQVDEDDDGIAERRRIVAAGNLETSPTILEDEPIDYQPYCVGVPFIQPHRVAGVSLYDTIKQVADVKTKVLRQLLTAGERAARSRLGVVGNQANIDDLNTSVFGGWVRLTTPNGVVPLPGDRYPAEVAELLGIMDKTRKESGGSAIDKANEEILVGGDTAHGLERIMSAMEQLNSLVAKTLAETLLAQIYVKIHSNLRKNFQGEAQAKVGGNWICSTPQLWPQRTHVTTALGLTMGDRLRQGQQYSVLIGEQKELMQQGSTLVTEQEMYRLLIARANALMIPHSYSYYIDPQSQQGQQLAQQKQQAMQEQKQMEMQVQMMNMQLLPQIEQIKAQSAATVQMLRNEIKQLELNMQQPVDMEELTLKYEELRLKLIELNAKYDNDPVPGGESSVKPNNT
jgi:hypothetical protein